MTCTSKCAFCSPVFPASHSFVPSPFVFETAFEEEECGDDDDEKARRAMRATVCANGSKASSSA